MRRKVLLGILVVCLFLAAGCGKVTEGEAHYSELDRYLVEKVKENYEDGTVEAFDLAEKMEEENLKIIEEQDLVQEKPGGEASPHSVPLN